MVRLTSTHGVIATKPAIAPKCTTHLKPEETVEMVFAFFPLRTWEVELAMEVPPDRVKNERSTLRFSSTLLKKALM
jgi:hypothetical protein